MVDRVALVRQGLVKFRAHGSGEEVSVAGQNPKPYMSYILNSLKGVIWGMKEGITIGDIKGDTRSLDYGSCHFSLVQHRWRLQTSRKVHVNKLRVNCWAIGVYQRKRNGSC